MEYEVACDCGWKARAPEAELIRLVQQHAREVHKIETTAEQVMALAKPVARS